jgi:hypothetical protein
MGKEITRQRKVAKAHEKLKKGKRVKQIQK